MNPEKPWEAGVRSSNVIDFAKEKAKREEVAIEAEEIREMDADSPEHFDFSNLPILPPVTAEELDRLPPFTTNNED